MTLKALSPTFDANPLHSLPAMCPAARGPKAQSQLDDTERIVWVRGCVKCGQLELSSFWGSAVLAKLVETQCRHCLSTEMAVCPVAMPAR